jgi:hypothetical protein
VKEGKVKAVDFSEEDMLRAYRYRELKNYAIGLCYPAAKADEYVSRDQIDFVKRRYLDKIISMRVYEPRLKALVAFIVKYKR